MTGLRAQDADALAAAALAAFALAVAAWLLPAGAQLTRDDGFYYFRIAQNVAAGAGSTFDGLNVTNGYHPLWLLVLVPVFQAFPGRDDGLRAAVALQGVLLAGAAALLYSTVRRALGLWAAVTAVLVWLLFAYREALSGLEFSLQSLLLAATALVSHRRLDRAGPPGPASTIGLGLLLAACALARLDNVLLALLVIAFVASEEAGPGRGGRLAALALPLLVALAVYAAVNIHLCGHPWPVSGLVKREWSRALLLQDPYYAAGGWPLAKLRALSWPLRALPQRFALALTLGTLGFGGVLLAARRGDGATRAALRAALRPWTPFALFGILQCLAYGLVYHGELSYVGAPWHYAVQPILAAVLLAALAEQAVEAARRRGLRMDWALPALAALAAASLAVVLARWRDHDRVRFTYQAAQWMADNLPPDARVGSWHAGALGYFSGRQVVNLDGLVNSWSYFRQGQRDLCAYWDGTGIGYLADTFDGTRAAVVDAARAAYSRCEDRLEPLWADERADGPWRVTVMRLRPAGSGALR